MSFAGKAGLGRIWFCPCFTSALLMSLEMANTQSTGSLRAQSSAWLHIQPRANPSYTFRLIIHL